MFANEHTSNTLTYFILATITTVGYGDVTLSSEYGRTAVSIFITLCLLLVPYYIGHINLQFKEKYPKIMIQYIMTNGIIVIGQYSELLYYLLRKLTYHGTTIAIFSDQQMSSDAQIAFIRQHHNMAIMGVNQLTTEFLHNHKVQLANMIVTYDDMYQNLKGLDPAILNFQSVVHATNYEIQSMVFVQKLKYALEARELL